MKMKEKAMPKQLIRVVYPIDGGKIMLRTAENWNANIEAHSVRRDGCLSEFQIETDRPYFYFKPVLIRDGATVWSRGRKLSCCRNVRCAAGGPSGFPRRHSLQCV